MTTTILEDARLFLLNSLRGKPNPFESKHPWRRGWEFAVLHSLRVEVYVTKILARESHSLSEHEITLLRLAAILHDAGRLEQREIHARLGAEIAGKWLREQEGHPLEDIDIKKVVDMIADHSTKDVREQDFEKAVLKDADTLDEIGVISIFMSANWIDPGTPFFFHLLRQRLLEFELPYCDKKQLILNTRGAQELLQEKKKFMESFIAQISDEIEADAQIENMLFEISKLTAETK